MDNKEIPILTLLQQIKSESTDPRGMDKDLREQVVEVLFLEGTSPSQIAQLLKVSDKTVRRDIVAIKKRNALSPSVDLARRLIGDLLLRSESHRASLMRLSRGRGGSVGERSQAEYLAWKITEELAKLLQTMGYLPQKPKQVVGDFMHHVNDQNKEKSFEELKEVLDEVLDVAEESGTVTAELKDNVNSLNTRLEKTRIEYEAKKLINEANQKNKEDQNERDI